MKKNIVILIAATAALVIVLALGRAANILPQNEQLFTTRTTNTMLLSSRDERAVVGEMVVYGTHTGYLARPSEDGVYPAVIMIHEWWGLNDQIKEMARVLAGEGYTVLAVDLYEGAVATTPQEAMQYRTAFTPAQTTEHLTAAAQYLTTNRGAERLAVLGWCYGGGKALEFSLSGFPLDGTVIYYGTPVTDPAQLQAIDWPVLGIFGDQDQSIPLATVEAFDAALADAGVEHSIVVYPGVGHAFANPSGEGYAPSETKDAWEQTLRFLDRTLRS